MDRFDAADSLRYYAQKVVECTEATHNRDDHKDALSVLGVTYLRESNYPKALDYFKQAEEECKEINDSIGLAKILINIGSIYMTTDSLQAAMRILMRSMTIFESLNDSSTLLYVYTNIGSLMGRVGNKSEQLAYSKKAFDMVDCKLNSRTALGLGCNLAINLSVNGLIDSSEALSLRVLAEARRIDYSKSTTQILNHLASIAITREQYERALTYTQEVVSYEGKFKHHHTFLYCYNYQGSALLKLGRVSEAVTSLEKALEYAELDKVPVGKERVLNNLHQAYAAAGKYAQAYETLKLYKQISDTLLGENNFKTINDLETKYQTEKKEQLLREMEQENQISVLKVKQRNIWIIVILILGFATALSIFFISRQRLLKQQQEALENRLLSLRVQLNPHFIFNALTAVQNYMLGGKDLREAVRYLSNFAKVMRAFLEYNQEETITLDKELHALELYVGIQKLRFSNGFEFDVEMDEALNPEEVLVPPMILQPLIENAIEHGIRNMDNGKISLNYELQGNSLVMKLRDNGIGRKRAAIDGPKVEEKTSLATRITEERIGLLNRKKKGTYSIEFADANEDGTGTVVTFKIPFAQL
ncbi:MAG: histidine kinase [Flavobacteriales bacterium]|nr:histidine kinase [Flavobacteriales bacterium]